MQNLSETGVFSLIFKASLSTKYSLSGPGSESKSHLNQSVIASRWCPTSHRCAFPIHPAGNLPKTMFHQVHVFTLSSGQPRVGHPQLDRPLLSSVDYSRRFLLCGNLEIGEWYSSQEMTNLVDLANLLHNGVPFLGKTSMLHHLASKAAVEMASHSWFNMLELCCTIARTLS